LRKYNYLYVLIAILKRKSIAFQVVFLNEIIDNETHARKEKYHNGIGEFIAHTKVKYLLKASHVLELHAHF